TDTPRPATAGLRAGRYPFPGASRPEPAPYGPAQGRRGRPPAGWDPPGAKAQGLSGRLRAKAINGGKVKKASGGRRWRLFALALVGRRVLGLGPGRGAQGDEKATVPAGLRRGS